MLGNGRYYAPRERTAGTRNFGYPKAHRPTGYRIRRRQPRAAWSRDETWKLTTAGPIRANNEYDGEEYDARMELAGWSRAGFDDSEWEPAQAVAAPAGVLDGADGRAAARHRDAAARQREAAQAGRLHLRHGPEHGGLVPAACRRSEGHRRSRCGTPRRCSPTARCTSPTCARARATDLYTLKGERHGDLGAALHLSRLPLRGSDRLPRRADGGGARRPRGARRHGRGPPISPAPTSCSTRSTTTCSGASAATTAASPPIARSATSARAGWATARQVSRSEILHVRRGGVLLQVDDRPGRFRSSPTAASRWSRPTTGRCTTTTSPGPAPSCSCPACSTTSTATGACWSATIRP